MEKCLRCGVEKDRSVLEVYPFPDDCVTTEIAIDPLFEIDCQPTKQGDLWRIVVVCHKCFHDLDPDIWTCQEHWESLKPQVAFNDLPELKEGT